jgi:hypothetical protein
VTLTDNPTFLWPTQYSTLTATANQDVGPTPYYLRIYDDTAGAYVATCASGTTCTTSVTQPTATVHSYTAVISYASPTYPPAGAQAYSQSVVWVDWQSISVSLAASPATLPVGNSSTLTATTSTNVGPTPFYTEIYDATTGTFLAECGWGTTCSATVSQSVATTHKYVAYVSQYGTAYPPPGIQATSSASFVTWSNLGWRISLSAPQSTYYSETVTAYVNGDVGPTPYYIEIFDENGTFVGSCGSGSACSLSYTPSIYGSYLVAFVTSYSTAYPPSGIVASSNVVYTYEKQIT